MFDVNDGKTASTHLRPALLIIVVSLIVVAAAYAVEPGTPPAPYSFKGIAPDNVEMREDAAVVKGYVLDEEDEAVPGALVVLLAENAYAYATTAEDGSFVIPNMAPGNYTAHATVEGYDEKTVENVELPARKTVQLKFRLAKN
jgi:hypothetical protein